MASTSAAENAAKVHSVANEGFLIEVGAKKVLIDALFDNQSISQRLELTFPSPVVFDTPLQIREF